MRIIRFTSAGQTYHGRPVDVKTAEILEGQLPGDLKPTGRVVAVDKLLAPLVPVDILCIGLNYRKHAEESGSAIPQHPMLFIKAGNTLNNPFDPIAIPKLSSQIDYEGELAIVIGKTAKDVSRSDALKYVFGYTIANDVSARDWQRDKALGGGQFARGKSFDGFCPLGPAIVTADEVPDPNALWLKTILNGQTVQDSTTADMIFDVATLISSLSSTMTLRPGAVILTGTPSGVGFARTPPLWLKHGDEIVIEIENLGQLKNSVI